jgi:translocation and assembly module TamA
VLVVFRIEPGPLYRLGALGIEAGGGGFQPPRPTDLGLKPGEPARAQAVLDAERELLRRARKAGHALAKPGRRSTVVDGETRTMDVTLRLAPGPKARFGEVTFRGAEGVVAEGFLRGRVSFGPGDAYDPDLVEAARRDLLDTNLFSTVVVREAGALAADGTLPVAVEISPRAARSVGVSGGFQTDSGPSARLFWENRNLLGAGERLRAETELRLDLQRAGLDLRKPDFLRRGQALVGEAEARAEETEAYETTSGSAGVGVERPLARGVVGGLGLSYRYAVIAEADEPETEFGLLSVPARLDWDFSDDPLNPGRGGKLALSAAPYLDTLDPSRRFLKSRLTHSRYLRLLEQPRLVLALRGSVGSALGVSREEIPADERFYAGGGGSVRGIPYQLAGPLDEDDDPLGGRSLLEVGAEIRYNFTESLGAVLFLDGGTVYSSAYPDFSEELLWGAGPGLRYYTPIGPLRLDVGVPLQPREGVDDLFQLYISIGQAF